MDDLILKVLRGSATDPERDRVAEWRRASPDHERQYRQAAAVWDLSSVAVDDRPVGAPPATRAIGRLAARRRGTARLLRLGIAAVIALALLGTGWFTVRWLDRPLLSVAATGDQTITLPDGSSVRLADGSRLEYRARAGRRLVDLNGRAFFAVASDSSSEFRVRVSQASISVLGTRFDVWPRGDSVRVAVLEGLVALQRRGEERRLPAGAVGIAHAGGVSLAAGVDATAALDWARPFFLFQNTPVASAVRELEARLGGRVIITDSVIGERLVTAQFAGEPFNDIAHTICMVVNARCTTVDGAVRMIR